MKDERTALGPNILCPDCYAIEGWRAKVLLTRSRRTLVRAMREGVHLQQRRVGLHRHPLRTVAARRRSHGGDVKEGDAVRFKDGEKYSYYNGKVLHVEGREALVKMVGGAQEWIDMKELVLLDEYGCAK